MNPFDDEAGGAVDMVPTRTGTTARARAGRGSAVHLLSYRQLVETASEPALVEGVLGVGDLAMLFAPSGSMKTFVVLDLSLRVATGKAWAGRACRQGPVLYIAAEGVGSVRDRSKAWVRQFEDSVAVEAELEANFFVIGGAVNFITVDFEGILEALGDRKFALIVVDTVARSMPGGDENKACDMGLFVAACDRLRTQTGAAVLVVHHSNKSKPDIERGSSALRAACDVVLVCTKSESLPPRVRVRGQKQRDGVELSATEFELEIVDLGSAVAGTPRASGRLRHRPKLGTLDGPSAKTSTGCTMERVLHVLVEDFSGCGATARELIDALGHPKNTVRRRLEDLVEAHLVRKDESGTSARFIPILGCLRAEDSAVAALPVACPSPSPTIPTSSHGTAQDRGASSSQSQSHALPLGEGGMGSGTPDRSTAPGALTGMGGAR